MSSPVVCNLANLPPPSARPLRPPTRSSRAVCGALKPDQTGGQERGSGRARERREPPTANTGSEQQPQPQADIQQQLRSRRDALRIVFAALAADQAAETLRLGVPAGRRAPRRASLRFLAAALAVGVVAANDPVAAAAAGREGEVAYSEDEWRERLGPEAYAVLRGEATEQPGSSPLLHEGRDGTFLCAGCGTPLFAAGAKYESGTGWPSFYEALPGSVDFVPDYSFPLAPRTEVRCRRCQGHLGHVFGDGPKPSGNRFCMNGCALSFQPKKQDGSNDSDSAKGQQ